MNVGILRIESQRSVEDRQSILRMPQASMGQPEIVLQIAALRGQEES
jgi:hypothetical protein